MKKYFYLLILFPQFLIAQNTSYTTQELAINDMLPGTLYLPEVKFPCPIVMLHAGSGATDRNGNQKGMENNSLKFLAQELAKNGIAVYSYDKRMFAMGSKPGFNERDLSFEDFIDDAALVINHFKNDPRFNKVIPAGHSEGSLICMVAAERTGADAFISIAGAGNPINVVIEGQIAKQAPFLVPETKKIFAELKKGDTVSVVSEHLMSLFRPSVQPYMISWVKYNPQDEIKKLNVPVLILNGTKDLQVGVTEAKLLKAAKPNAEILLIENMNHVLKEIKTDDKENMASYNNKELPVMKELVDAIVGFVERVKK